MLAQVDPAPGVDIRLLGPVEVLVAGRPLVVDTRKAIALLAYLATNGRATSREALAALLWPEAADAESRGALRRTLSVLNAALGGVGLVIDRASVALDGAACVVDLHSFLAAVGRARGHGHPAAQACEPCRTALEEAIALDRGPLMDGFSLRDSEPWDEWLTERREAHQRDLAGALERLVGERMAAGAWGRAIAVGRRWLELDPLHEPAHRALMESYARSGEVAAAVRQYRDAAATLDRELSVTPLPETTRLYESIVAATLPPVATAAEAQEVRAVATAVPGTPRLVGRTRELDRMLAVLGGVGPAGGLVALEGEAGIGKSRLADAVTATALATSHPVAAARCYRGEAGITLGPIVALLRARLADAPGGSPRLSRHTLGRLSTLVPELDAGHRAGGSAREPGPTARLALLEAIAEGLVGASGGIATTDPGRPAPVIRLDDIQWADDSTLEVLGFLVRRLDRLPLLLLLSWRREDLDERAEALAAEVTARPGALVRLGRLDATETRILIDALVASGRPVPSPSTIEELIVEAEGLPLYVVEALATDDQPAGSVPMGIRALLAARLAALGDLGTQVTAAAAVIGRSFDPDIVRMVSGRSDVETVVALEELVRRGIVREAPAEDPARHVVSFDFAHARLRDVAYDATSLARRRLLHARAAEAYRAGGARDAEPMARLARIAHHEQRAGRPRQAADAFREAGDLARAVFANREALVHLEAALALGHHDTLDLREAIADLRTRIGDYAGAIAALEAAAAGAPAARLAGIEHRLGRIHLRRGDPVAAEAHLSAAAQALGDGDGRDPLLESRLLADRAVAAARAGDPTRAAVLAEQARVLATGDLATEVEADRIVGLLARERGDRGAARVALERSAAGAARLTDPVPSIAAGNAMALLAAEEGDLPVAMALATTALEAARRAGERHLEAALQNNLADMLRAAGRSEEAMERLKAAAAAFADIGGRPGELEPGVWMLEAW